MQSKWKSLRDKLGVPAIVVAVILAALWLEVPARIVNPNAPVPEGLRRLVETATLMGQTAPALGIPVNPASLYGSAVIYYGTTSGGGTITLTAGGPTKAIAATQRLYIYTAMCVNTSSTGVAALLADTASSPVTYGYIGCPASGANAPVSFNPPLALTMGKLLTMAATTGESTIYFYASGYYDLR